jgi:hypothetical protein
LIDKRGAARPGATALQRCNVGINLPFTGRAATAFRRLAIMPRQRRTDFYMKQLLLIAATSAAMFSTTAFAQMGGMSGMQGGAPRQITRQEAQQFADAMFQRFDLNHDGVVTRDEAEQVRAQMAQGQDGNDSGRGQKMIDRVFGTSQSLTQPQFEAQALARFDSQDANHDGVVSPEERHNGRARQ